jgi:hypothetical protein
MRKHQMFLTALSLSLLFACGEKQPPPNVSDPGGLGSSLENPGGFEPIDSTPEDTTSGISPAPDLVPGDDFVDEPAVEEPAVEEPAVEEPVVEEPVVEEPVCETVAEDGSCLDETTTEEPTTEPTVEPTAEPEPEPTATAIPTVPANVSASNATASGFNVSWSSVSGATSYKVYLNGSLKSDNITSTSFAATGLTPATSYSITVSAVTSNGEQAQSDAVKITTSAIGAPQGLKANSVGGNSVSISWNSVANATGYKVYLNGALNQDNVIASNAVVTGLTAETAYTISVSAITSAGESSKSSALSVTTIDPYGNKRLGFLQVPAMNDMDGLDIKNNHAYIGHFVAGGIFSSNKRYVRDFNLSSGQYQDIEISTQGETKIAGVAVSSATVWTAIGQFDKDDRNLYKHNITGQQLNRYKVGQSGTLLSDVTVDPLTGFVYMGSRTSNSIIKYNPTDSSSQQFFSGTDPVDPLGLTVDASGNVYTFDGISRKVVKYSKADGAELLSFGPTGTNGTGEDYGAVSDLGVDPRNGDIYVVGSSSSGIKIFRYDSSGNFLRSIKDEELVSPRKISVDSSGKVYVIDSIKKGVLVFEAGVKP